MLAVVFGVMENVGNRVDCNWQRIKHVFGQALDVPEERRREFLDDACGDDELLRAELDELLLRSSDNERFLEPPG